MPGCPAVEQLQETSKDQGQKRMVIIDIVTENTIGVILAKAFHGPASEEMVSPGRDLAKIFGSNPAKIR